MSPVERLKHIAVPDKSNTIEVLKNRQTTRNLNQFYRQVLLSILYVLGVSIGFLVVGHLTTFFKNSPSTTVLVPYFTFLFSLALLLSIGEHCIDKLVQNRRK